MNTANRELRISVLPGQMSVCRLNGTSKVPDWALESDFFSVTRTADELSVVCPDGAAPEGVRREDGWRALKLEGPFGFSEVGVLASVAGPLAEAGVSVFVVSTFDTDYVLVKQEQLDPAVATLRERGHEIP